MLTVAKIRADCQPKTLFSGAHSRVSQEKAIHSDGRPAVRRFPENSEITRSCAVSCAYEYKDPTPELNGRAAPDLSSLLLPAASVSDIRKAALEIAGQVTWVGRDVNRAVDS